MKTRLMIITLFVALAVAAIFLQETAFSDPTPDIKVNDSDTIVMQTPNDTLTVKVSMTPGTADGTDGDWWVAYDNTRVWLAYDYATSTWVNNNYTVPTLPVTYQGPMQTVTSLELKSPSLKGGLYSFYFGTDLTRNGTIDYDTVKYDAVTVRILEFSSPDFEYNKALPSAYTCDGTGITPQLHWDNIPGDAESYVLIMDDPAMTPVVTHWIAYNIPGTSSGLPENFLVSTGPIRQGTNSYGERSYDPPCPTIGESHTYYFRLYALNTAELDLSASDTRSSVDAAITTYLVTGYPLILKATYTRQGVTVTTN